MRLLKLRAARLTHVPLHRSPWKDADKNKANRRNERVVTHVSRGARVSVAHVSSAAWRGRSFPPDRPCPSRSAARSRRKSRAPAERLWKLRSRSHRYTPPPSHQPHPPSETRSCPPAGMYTSPVTWCIFSSCAA